MNKNVTIALPTYNGATFLESAIESIAKQTYKYIKVLIIDDNSSDNTLEISEKLKKSIPF